MLGSETNAVSSDLAKVVQAESVRGWPIKFVCVARTDSMRTCGQDCGIGAPDLHARHFRMGKSRIFRRRRVRAKRLLVSDNAADLARASAKRDRLEGPAYVGPDRHLDVEANQ